MLFSLRRENSECHCTVHVFHTAFILCAGPIIHSELWMISTEWFGPSFFFSEKYTLFPLPLRGGVLAFGWGIRSQFFPRILGFEVLVSGNHTAALNVKSVGKIQSLSPDYIVVSGPNQLFRAWYNSLHGIQRKVRLWQKLLFRSFDMFGF